MRLTPIALTTIVLTAGCDSATGVWTGRCDATWTAEEDSGTTEYDGADLELSLTESSDGTVGGDGSVDLVVGGQATGSDIQVTVSGTVTNDVDLDMSLSEDAGEREFGIAGTRSQNRITGTCSETSVGWSGTVTLDRESISR